MAPVAISGFTTASSGDGSCLLRFHTTLASLFRQPSPRSLVPPSSYSGGLQPVGSRDPHGQSHRRVSRTDLDFEQALRAEGTVVLKESLDVDTLGVLDTSNSSINSSSPFSSPSPPQKTPYIGFQPATPTIVPPTPSPGSRAAGPSNIYARDSSSSSSGPEIYYDAVEDTDLQTKRRSMYRSAGTASSPDLATLLRKSKRESAARREGRSGDTTPLPPLTPNRRPEDTNASPGSRAGRGRSSTSSSAASPSVASPRAPHASKGKGKASGLLSNSGSGASNPDSSWVLASPRSMASMRDISSKVSLHLS